MKKSNLLWVAVLSVVISLSLARPAYAYIDPGTTGSIFGMVAPFIAIALAILGFMIRPFRVFFANLINRFRGNPEGESPASDEQEEPAESPDDEESGKNQNEENPS